MPSSYSVESGQICYVGSAGIPGYVLGQTGNTWAQIPFAATLDEQDPADNPAINPDFPGTAPWRGASGGFAAMMNAWNGGILDQNACEFWLPLQYGHTDGWDNAPWRARFRQEVPDWTMLLNPTGAIGNEGTLDDGLETTGVYYDGRRRAIHSYNKHAWSPEHGIYCLVQGNCADSGSAGTAHTLKFREDYNWDHVATHPTPGTSSGAGTCWDEVREVFWYKSADTGLFWFFDPVDEDWASLGTSYSLSGNVKLVRIPADSASSAADLVVFFNVTPTDDFGIFDPSDGSRSFPAKSGTHDGMTMSGSMGAAWVEPLGCICMWHSTTNRTKIYTLTPGADPKVDDWTVGELTVDAANAITPSSCQTNGTFGRFDYVQTLNGFFLINNVTEPGYFFKLGAQ